MMKVCYSEMDTPAGLSCRLEADGHAGYAPAGQDIVCAGASTVMQGLVYLLAGEENIREVIAFPLNSNAQDMLLGAPTAVTEQQLREAHIRIR